MSVSLRDLTREFSLDEESYRSSEDSAGSLREFIVDDDESSESSTEEKRDKVKDRKLKSYDYRDSTRKAASKSGGSGKPIRKKRRREFEEEDVEVLREQVLLQNRILSELGTGGNATTVVGREGEARQIMGMLLQPEGGVRPLLLGKAGIGKMSIVDRVANLFKTSPRFSSWKDRRIFCLDCSELLANCISESYAATVAGELQHFIEFALKGRGSRILYFRNIDRIAHLEQVTDYVQSILKNRIPFIASISEDPKDENIAKTITLLSNFNFATVNIEEVPECDVVQIVKNHLIRHPLHPRLSISDATIDLAVRLASKYVCDRPFPMKAINLIQECANRVLFTGMTMGKIEIMPADIAKVVASKKGIDPEDLMDDAVFNERRFIERLKEQIVGQDFAIETVCQRVAGYKMGLLDSKKPWGVFLFVGPTGVGKTELARNLARLLFNDEKTLICIDGSEYKESHTLSNLIGSPLGYEGHDTGGLLTDPLLQNPHQVVLLDEFEKFHPDVQRLFLQVFDRGTLTDRRGKSVDCTNALFIMTSNLGSDKLFELCKDTELDAGDINDVLKPILVENLSPELCNRFTAVVPFQPLKKEHLPTLVRVQLERIMERLASQAGIEFVWTDELIQHFAGLDVDLRFGMRDFCRRVDGEVVNILKDAGRKNKQRLQGRLTLDFKENKFVLRMK